MLVRSILVNWNDFLRQMRFLSLYAFSFFYVLLSSFTAKGQNVQWASKVLEVSSELSSKQNAALQALGAPSVFPQGGNSPSAWEPGSKTKIQFIKIGFKKPMKPQQIVVAENYKPGAVSKIVLIDKTGKEHVVKRLKPKPIKEEKRILCLPLQHIDFETTSMKLYLDIKNFEEMPQIDAIGMSEEKEAFQPKINLANIDMEGSDAVNLGDSVNTIFKEIAPIISPDNRTLYFTRDNDPQNIGGEKQDIW
ncbi:MAG TPA: hypothetical protein DCR46_00455 [Cytophagales bacterium]|nr:hypothetical protein [Cytophagales bacterium]